MGWRVLLEPDIQDFMRLHGDDDVRDLGLKKPPNASWPYGLVLDQIKVRQKARAKAPFLYKTDRFVFPNSNVFEQASSQACARYKAGLLAGDRFVDLTGGSGVDAFCFSDHFKGGVVVERGEMNAHILDHNARVLHLDLAVVHGDACDYAREMAAVDVVYIDPQRRDEQRKGKYDLSACSPDILSLLPVLCQKAKGLILKTSPFLDIDRSLAALKYVRAVHVLQWQGECKEVVYVLDFVDNCAVDDVVIHACALDDEGGVLARFSFTRAMEKAAEPEYGLPMRFIYEPGPAFQKAGGFKALSVRYGLKKLHPHTHLYTSDCVIDGFVGKFYEVEGVIAPKMKDLGISKADLRLRNYPGTVQMLRKKLKLSEGGVHRVYAVTLLDGQKRLIICRK